MQNCILLKLRINYPGVMIPGVKVHKIASPEELFGLLEQGNKRRTQHPTDANAESSRSHAVFQVYIQMTNKGSREVSFTITVNDRHLVYAKCNFPGSKS